MRKGRRKQNNINTTVSQFRDKESEHGGLVDLAVWLVEHASISKDQPDVVSILLHALVSMTLQPCLYSSEVHGGVDGVVVER